MSAWLAPAKVNLALEVRARRPDGFHDIRTVFQAIDLGDRLTISRSRPGTFQLRCDWPGIPAGEENLVTRAWRLLERRRSLPAGVEVGLEKQVPPGAGLGGGSSDAAALLVAASAELGLELAPPELEELAAELGSDVAFFIRGGTQLGEGRGERLTPWPPLTRGAFVIVWPGFVLPTPAVYGAGGFGLTPTPDPFTLLRLGIAREDPEGVAKGFFNALEAPAFSLQPALAGVKGQLLGLGALGGLLCGSGSSVFAYFRDEGEARRAGASVPPGVRRVHLALPLGSGVRRIA